MESQDPSLSEEVRLLQLAVAIADGTPVDWTAAGSSEIGSSRDLARLRHVELMVQGHSALRTQILSRDPAPAHETLFTEARRSGHIDTSAAMRVRWGPLVVHEKIGRGSFGDVYRAWDPRLERYVALKLIPERPTSTDDSPVVQEGRLLARVRHPNVLTVHGAERIDGRIGIWTEYVAGETLASEIRRQGPLPIDEAVRIGIDVCRALGAVHAAGLLHRDVKAQNVFRDDARIVLGDFGTGIEFDDDARVGAPQIAGTPLYLAPEIFRRAPATIASDLYSVGVLLYFLLTGDYPVRGSTFAEIRRAHANGTGTPIETARPDCPAALRAIVERALSSDPVQRFEAATAFETALTEWQLRSLETVPSTGSTSGVHRTDRAARRRWMSTTMMISGAVATAIVAAVTVASWTRWRVPTPAVRLESAPTSPAQLSPPVVPPAAPPSEPTAVRSPVPLTSPTEGSLVTLRKIDADMDLGKVNIRALGSDGRLATCTRGGLSAVALCDLTTRSIHELRVPRSSKEGSRDARLSPDGKEVAYLWSDDTGTTTLRVVGADGTGDREVYRPPAGNLSALTKWVQSGRAMLVVLSPGPGETRHVAAPLDGGEAEEVWRFERPQVEIDLSPDDRYIVFSRAGDIVILDRHTGEESRLVTHPDNDSRPRWTPDGRAIVFLSDRIGSTGLFALPVADGRASGDAKLVHDLGRSTVNTLRFAGDGTLFAVIIARWLDAFRATVDLGAGVIGVPAKLVARSIDDTAAPDWSADGSRFAYVSGWIGGPKDVRAYVVVQRADGGVDRSVALDSGMDRHSALRWSPDGRHLAVRHGSIDGAWVVDLIDSDTGTVRRLVRELKPESHLAWTSDGAGIYYTDTANQILRLDIASSTSEPIIKDRIDFLPLDSFDVSAFDGSVAIGTRGTGGTCDLQILKNGGQKVHRHTFAGYPCSAITWSRDGSRLLVSIMTRVADPAQLWVIDAEAGDPVRLIVPQESIATLSLGPGDRELLFTAGNPGPEFLTLSGISVPANATAAAAAAPVAPARRKVD